MLVEVSSQPLSCPAIRRLVQDQKRTCEGEPAHRSYKLVLPVLSSPIIFYYLCLLGLC